MAEENEHQVKLTADITGLKKALKEAQKELDKVDEKADKANTTAKKFTGTIENWSDEPRTAFQQMLDITEDYYHELEKASDAIQQYKKQASSAGADTDKLSNNVSNASAKIAESYRKMTDSLAAIGGKDWDTNVEFKGLKGDVQNVEEEFKNVENEYKTLLNELETGGNAQNTAQALTDVKDKAEEVSESFVDAGQESAQGLDAITEEADVIENAYSDAGQNVAQDFGSMEQSAEQAGDAFADVCNEVETESKGMSFASIGDAIAGAFERVRGLTDDFLGSLKMDATDPTQQMAQDVDQFGRSLENATQQAEMFEDAWNQATWPTEEMAEEASELERHIDDVNAEMERLKTQETPTQEFIDLQNQIAKAEQQLEKYYNRQEKYEATGVKQDSRSWTSLQYDIQTTENQLSHLETAMDNLKDAGRDVEINPDSKQIEKLQKDLDKSNEQLKKMQDEADKAAKSVDNIGTASSSSAGGLGSIVSSIASALSPITGILSKIGSTIMSGLGNIINAGINLIKSALSALVTLVGNIAKSIWNSLKKIVSTAVDVAKNIAQIASKPVINGLKSLAKWIAQAGLGLVGFNSDAEKSVDIVKQLTNAWTSLCNQLKSQIVRSAAKAILADVEEVMVAIAGVSDEFNETMSGMIDSAKALGAQIVAIVEPIINAIGPYLIQIMDWLTGVADAAAQFVARITGNDTYIKASKGQSDYASSLDDTTESTKKATKATQEYQNTVLAFDQLNKLDDVSSTVADEDEESIIGVSDADLKKAQTQASALNDLADDIYKAFTNKDWYKMGQGAGEALTKFFDWLDELVGWEKNWEKFSRWIQNAIDWVNGLIVGTDWVQIGKDIGDILNTIIETFKMITDPVSGIDFRGLGQGIGKMLVSAIETIKWKDLGYAIIQGMQAAVNFVVGILDEKVGKKLGEGLADCISGIADGMDPEVWSDLIVGLFDNFFDFFIELFSNPEDFAKLGYKIGAGLADAIKRIDLSKVYAAMDNFWTSLTAALSNFEAGFSDYFDLEDGESVWTALGEGLMIGIQGIMQWLTENVLNGETGKALGEGIADFISGLAQGFESDTWADFFDGLGEFLGELLTAVFSDTETWYSIGQQLGETIVKILGTGADDAADDLDSDSNGIGDGLHALWEAFIAALTGIDDSEAFASIGEALHNLIQDIKEGLNDPTFQKELQEVKGIFEDCIRQIFGIPNDQGIMDYFAEQLGEIIGKAIDYAWENYVPHYLRDWEDNNAESLVEGTEYAERESKNLLDVITAFDTAASAQGYTHITTNVKDVIRQLENDGYEVQAAIIQTYAEEHDCLDMSVKEFDEYVADDTVLLTAQLAEASGTTIQEIYDCSDETAEAILNGDVFGTNAISLKWAAEHGILGESYKEAAEEWEYATGMYIDTGDELCGVLSDLGVDVDSVSIGTYNAFKDAFDKINEDAMFYIDETTNTITWVYEEDGKMISMSVDDFCTYFSDAFDEGMSRVDDTTSEGCDSIVGDAEDVAASVDEAGNIIKTSAKKSDVFGAETIGNALSEDMASVDSDYAMAENAFLSHGTSLSGIINSTSSGLQTLTYTASDENSKAYQTYFDEGESELNIGWNDIGDALQAGADIFNNNTSVFDAIKNFFEKLVEKISPVFTWISDAISKFFGTNTLSVSGGALTYSVPQLASGGRLDDGQLFIANENGAEMIGRYGSSTGVMNNEQIVQAVTDGVRTAVTEAWNNSNQDSGDIVLYIDSEEIARASTKGNRSIQKRTNPVVSFA